jgi:hypothetical protein
VVETGRWRRWSADEKLRILPESLEALRDIVVRRRGMEAQKKKGRQCLPAQFTGNKITELVLAQHRTAETIVDACGDQARI